MPREISYFLILSVFLISLFRTPSKNWTISKWPFITATSMAVFPDLLRAEMSAPFYRLVLTAARSFLSVAVKSCCVAIDGFWAHAIRGLEAVTISIANARNATVLRRKPLFGTNNPILFNHTPEKVMTRWWCPAGFATVAKMPGCTWLFCLNFCCFWG